MRHIVSIACIAAALVAPVSASAGVLEQSAQTALTRALQDEYHAEAFYAAVMERHGAVRPFANIIKAERMHASMVAGLMEQYGMMVPENDLLGSEKVAAAVPASIGEACRMGVDAEIANRDLYQDELMPAAAGHADIEAVFERLRAASEDNHLPAFERCAARN